MKSPIPALVILLLLSFLLAACQAILPQDDPGSNPTAVSGARQALASQLALPPEAISPIEQEPVDWPDTCLGVRLEDQFCAQILTRGYRMVLEAEGLTFQVHTDQAGEQVVLAGAPGGAEGPALEWRREGGIAGFCDELRIYPTGDVYAQTCGANAPVRGHLSPDQLWQLYSWLNRLAPFEVTEGDPEVADAMFFTLRFRGAGENPADPSARESMLDLAGNLYAELQTREATPTAEPAPSEPSGQGAGLVSGRVCYPSEFIPALTAYFQNTLDQSVTPLPIAENQTSYQVNLPAGTYLAYAWRNEASLAGGYTAYIACGAIESCTDHSLLPFQVDASRGTTGIDLCDWPLSEVPLPPGGLPGEETHSVDPALSGLTLLSRDGIWHIAAGGQLSSVYNRAESIINPDLSQALFWDGQDLWLHDLTGGAPRNLTNTPNRIELLPGAWPAASGRLFFTSYDSTTEGGPGLTGFLTVVNLDGNGYQVLDAEHMAGAPAVSPDGSTIAYGQGSNGWLYRWDAGTAALNPEEFGLDEVAAMGSPAWSPDGNRIAWVVAGRVDGQDRFGVGVFDLNSERGWWLHPHPLPGMDGFPPAPVWSPDSQRLAYHAFDENLERSGVWVLDVEDAGDERYLGTGGNPRWSPDGRWLAFAGMGGEIQLASTDSWAIQPISLPIKGAWLYDWQN